MMEITVVIGCLVIFTGLVWIVGVVLYGGLYFSARLIDLWSDKQDDGYR